jgi:hypothetical protein
MLRFELHTGTNVFKYSIAHNLIAIVKKRNVVIKINWYSVTSIFIEEFVSHKSFIRPWVSTDYKLLKFLMNHHCFFCLGITQMIQILRIIYCWQFYLLIILLLIEFLLQSVIIWSISFKYFVDNHLLPTRLLFFAKNVLLLLGSLIILLEICLFRRYQLILKDWSGRFFSKIS